MTEMSGAGSQTVDLTLSVPAQGGLRIIAVDIIAKIAEFLGTAVSGLAGALESAAAQVAPPGSDGTIAFQFRTEDRDLLIHARCGDRTSEVRYRLNS